jgi:hypothetical protein
MGVSGSWAANNIITGAAKWGTGINPVHSSSDAGYGRQYSTDPGNDLGDVPDSIIAEDYGYTAGDYLGEDEAGLRQVYDRPGWGEHVDRADIPGNYPQWGNAGIEEAQEYHEIPHASQEEAGHAVAVYPGGVSGGWLAKVTSRINTPVTSNPAQYEVNTSMRQGPGVGVMNNTRAVARSTDDARSPVTSRDMAMVAKTWAKDWEHGGGLGTPRMFPYQQDEQRRPFYFRSPGLPPLEPNGAGTPEGRIPYTYQEPAEPDPGAPATSSASNNWGYTDGELY